MRYAITHPHSRAPPPVCVLPHTAFCMATILSASTEYSVSPGSTLTLTFFISGPLPTDPVLSTSVHTLSTPLNICAQQRESMGGRRWAARGR